MATTAATRLLCRSTSSFDVESPSSPVVPSIKEWDQLLGRGDALFFAVAPHRAVLDLFHEMTPQEQTALKRWQRSYYKGVLVFLLSAGLHVGMVAGFLFVLMFISLGKTGANEPPPEAQPTAGKKEAR